MNSIIITIYLLGCIGIAVLAKYIDVYLDKTKYAKEPEWLDNLGIFPLEDEDWAIVAFICVIWPVAVPILLVIGFILTAVENLNKVIDQATDEHINNEKDEK